MIGTRGSKLDNEIVLDPVHENSYAHADPQVPALSSDIPGPAHVAGSFDRSYERHLKNLGDPNVDAGPVGRKGGSNFLRISQ